MSDIESESETERDDVNTLRIKSYLSFELSLLYDLPIGTKMFVTEIIRTNTKYIHDHKMRIGINIIPNKKMRDIFKYPVEKVFKLLNLYGEFIKPNVLDVSENEYYMIIGNKKKELFEKIYLELYEKTWHPSRLFKWCIPSEDKL